MNDDLTPDPLDAGDPFASSLGDCLHGAADGIDGAGVTQAGVAAAVTGRRRSVRTRAVAGGIAAAVVLLGAVAVAGPFRDDEPERISAGGPTATEPCTRTASITSGSVTTTTAATTTTEVPTTEPAPSSSGQTPFEQWADVLREGGLLTAEQEAEIAAGRGISLTPEQSQVLQAYWDGQAGIPTTTVLALPNPTPPAGTVDVPCEDAGGSGTTSPAGGSSETGTTEPGSDDPPLTSTTVAGSDDPPVTTTSVAGSDVAPPTTSTAPAPPS